MKIAFKLTASLLIAVLCFVFATAILVKQVEIVARTMGYGLPLLFVPLSWLPISTAVFLGLALRKWWVVASLPLYLCIKYVPAIVLAMIVWNDTRRDVATMGYSTDALPQITEYTRFRVDGSGLESDDEQALLTSKVGRIVVVYPNAWKRQSTPLEQVNLDEAEVRAFRRVGIDQCSSKEYLKLPIDTAPEGAACVVSVPFNGDLPKYALFHIERDTEEAREYSFTFASLEHAPPADDGTAGNVFLVHPKMEVLQKSRKVTAASYLPQSWLIRQFAPDEGRSRKKKPPVPMMTKRYPNRDFARIYTEIFPARADFVPPPPQVPGIDTYIPYEAPNGYRRAYQKITATRTAGDWLAALQAYHDRYMQNVPDASRADIYRRLRIPSLILCHGGQYSALTVSILSEYDADIYDCLDDLPEELVVVHEKRRAEIAHREFIARRLEELAEQRRLSLADGFPIEQLSARFASEPQTLYQNGAHGIDQDSVEDDLHLAVHIVPGDTPYQAELAASFKIPENIKLAQFIALSCPGMTDLPLSGPAIVKYSRRHKVSSGKVTLQLTDEGRAQLKTGLASGKCTLEYGSPLYQYSAPLPAGREFHMLQGLNAIDAANRYVDEMREVAQELATLN